MLDRNTKNIKFSLGKGKKLKSRKAIQSLFDEGKKIYFSPIKAVYSISEASGFSVKLGVSVPKKKFKSAVSRNKIKRQLREAYRINQYLIEKKNKKEINLMLIYAPNKSLNFSQIENSVIQILNHLNTSSPEDTSK